MFRQIQNDNSGCSLEKVVNDPEAFQACEQKKPSCEKSETSSGEAKSPRVKFAEGKFRVTCEDGSW